MEISALVANKNDPLSRFLDYFKASITTDVLKGALDGLTESLKQITEYEINKAENAPEEATE